MNIKNILITLVAITLLSCDDFLDIKPKGKIIPENISDYEAMLYVDNSFYTFDRIIAYGTDEYYIADKFYNENRTSQIKKNCYSWNSEIYDVASVSKSSWHKLYKNIYRSNLIIDGASEVEGASEVKTVVKAEAMAKRALYYFYLVNIYAKHYNEKSSSTDKGVPLIDNSDLERGELTRASVKEIYDFIISDLKYAIKELPEETESKFRLSKDAAKSILARVYFYMGNYNACMNLVDELFKSDIRIADYNTIKYKVSPRYGVYVKEAPKYDENPENFYIEINSGRPRFEAADELLNIFPEDKSDLRSFLQFKHHYRTKQLKYRCITGFRINSSVSVPELLLCRAEMNARKGDAFKQKVIDDLNYLRKNRIKNENYEDLKVSDFTTKTLLKFVLDERRRELCFKGLRWFDLKRLNLEIDHKSTLKRTINGQEHILNPDSPRYIYPIPFDILSFNPDMVQNKR